MSIWFTRPDVETLNRIHLNTALERLGIEITEVGDDFMRGTLPVDDRTVQPMGLLHGGISVVLAETLGSAASNFCIDQQRFSCVGLDINANHVRGVKSGLITGTARPFHLGRKSHVWDVRLEDEADRLVCVARLTVMIIEQPTAFRQSCESTMRRPMT